MIDFPVYYSKYNKKYKPWKIWWWREAFCSHRAWTRVGEYGGAILKCNKCGGLIGVLQYNTWETGHD